MKWCISLLAALALAGPFAGTLGAQTPDRDRSFYVGKGPAVSFYIEDGEVRRALLQAKRVECDRSSVNLFKRFPAFRQDDSGEFERKRRQFGLYKWHFAGQVNGSEASGTMRLASGAARQGECDTGFLDWDADRVSFSEWKAANDDVPPRR